ncbi:MAG: hypothetical protein SF029_10315 [bacterium]|nr:hypothetical protein [bacterium]
MAKWDWLTKPSEPYTWGFALRVIVKATALFVLVNLVFALVQPVPALGHVSLYNTLLPGRDRLPYGENPAESYNLSLYSLPAMFAAHEITRPKAPDEFRVVLLGDSGTWGWLLENDDTLSGQLNALDLRTNDGRRVVVYNLGYPIMSLTKDLLILERAMAYEPDLIVWLVTLESFPREQQLYPPIVQNNAAAVRRLIDTYNLALDPADPRLVETDFWQNTLVGQRRALADWMRLQLYAFPWAATGVDQAIPAEYTPRTSDFDEDVRWNGFDHPQPLTEDDLAFEVLRAGAEMAGDVPVWVVNEPMFISSGENSDLRYNAFYPRWAYDDYREQLTDMSESDGWRYLDLWDFLPPDEFTDSPVHTTPEGARLVAERLAQLFSENSAF